MRLVETIDGLMDADAKPSKRGRGRPTDADAAARAYLIAQFVFRDRQARRGLMKVSISFASEHFHCSEKHVKAALRTFRQDLPIETASWFLGDGTRVRRLRGVDGRWRTVPAHRLPAPPK